MDNIMLDLIDEFLIVEEGAEETWKIEDDLSADWCLDKIREIQAKQRRYEMVVNDKIAQLNHKLKMEKEKAEREASFFESKLREYFELESTLKHAKETKTLKTYSLPSGRLKLTKGKKVFNYDKDKLLEYAKENKMKDYIKITEEFRWGDFKKQLEIKEDIILNKETGEIVEIEGLTIEDTVEEFKVEV